MKRNQGRPRLGKIKTTVTMTPSAREDAIAMAAERGMTMGILFEELVRQERVRENERSVDRATANRR